MGVYEDAAQDILLQLRNELHFQIERSSQVKSACRDGFQLSVSTHVSTAAGNASVLQGIIQARDEDVTNASVQETKVQSASSERRRDSKPFGV